MLIFIWSGLGFLVPLIMIASLLFSNVVLNKLFGAGFYSHSDWGPTLAFIIASAIIWSIGHKLAQQKGRVVIDKQTSKEIVLRRKHSFFFINFMYWSYINIGLAVAILILKG